MTYESRIGRVLLALVFVALGVQCLLLGKFVVGLEPIAKVFAMPWASVTGVVLIGAGLSLLADRTARAGALVLAGLLVASTVALHGPLLMAHLKEDADDAFHTLAIAAGALAMAATSARRAGAGRVGLAARLTFGVCTIGHGVMHFVFFKFTADFIPAFIPWHAFWAAATGAAQIAAGLAILSGVLARLAATLTGVMYASWVPLVHVPRVIATPSVYGEWTDIAIAAGLCASALLVAGILGTGQGARLASDAVDES